MKTQPNRPVRDLNPRASQGNTPPSFPMTGVLRDTIVLTRNGEVAVQNIQPGDHIITRDAGMVKIRSIGRHRALLHAISIAAGSLGDTRPDTNMVLPATQQILVRDWRALALFGCDQALVPVSALVDGEFICDLGLQVLELYTLRFEAEHVIYAGGLEVAGATDVNVDLRPAA